ncbi:hypothetical protein DFJ73DRAFT_758536 [Zopfochytrium polystomum]|nr:hypothetical protein DFJ73DRAFT_758536 [Zopfochytrium polystomum]
MRRHGTALHLLLLLLLGMAPVLSAPTPGQEEINEIMEKVRAKMEDVTTGNYRPGDFDRHRQQKIFNRPNDIMSGVLAASKHGTVEVSIDGSYHRDDINAAMGRIRASNPAYNSDPGKVLMENGKAIDDPLPNTDGFTISSKDVDGKGGGRVQSNVIGVQKNGKKLGFDIHCNSIDRRDGSETACQRRVSNLNAELKSKSKTSNGESDPQLVPKATLKSLREKKLKQSDVNKLRAAEGKKTIDFTSKTPAKRFPTVQTKNDNNKALPSVRGGSGSKTSTQNQGPLVSNVRSKADRKAIAKKSTKRNKKASKSKTPSSKKSSRNKKVHLGKKPAKKAVGKKSPKKPNSRRQEIGKKVRRQKRLEGKTQEDGDSPPSPPPTRR